MDDKSLPVQKAVSKIIELLGLEGEIYVDDALHNDSKTSSSVHQKIILHIILQNDGNDNLNPCRDLLDQPSDNDKKRFLFLHTNDDAYSKEVDFWEKLLCNLRLGKSAHVFIHDVKMERCTSFFEVLEEFAAEDELDLEFVEKVLKKTEILQKSFRNDFGETKTGQKPYIDQIDSPEVLDHLSSNGGNRSANERFYSLIRRAMLDWAKQNDWVLRKDYYKGNFNFLIIDDLMCEQNWPQVKNSTKIEREENFSICLSKCQDIFSNLSDRILNFYRLLKPHDASKFSEYIKNILKDNTEPCCSFTFSTDNGTSSDTLKTLLSNNGITHILVDWRLDKSGQYTGLNLVREIKSWIDNKLSDDDLIPELLILSRNSAPATIQAAFDSGASGYVLKDDIAELPYVVGRAGKPLTVNQKKEINLFVSDNFPSLRRFPTFVPKALYFDKWKKIKSYDPLDSNESADKDYEGNYSVIKHSKWLKKIPKADLHVHIGTAFELDLCYDLAVISLYRWYEQFKGEEGTHKEVYNQMVATANMITDILNSTKEEIIKSEEKDRGEKFRDCFIKEFKDKTGIYEVATVNNTINQLTSIYNKLSGEQIACLLIVGLGCQIDNYKKDTLIRRVDEVTKICKKISLVSGKEKDPLLSFYLQDSKKMIEEVNDRFKKTEEVVNNISSTVEALFGGIKSVWEFKKINPLSSLLSLPDSVQKESQGLLKYLGADDLVGASLLQFTETLLLASYNIPKWAAEQNVWHQELRASPTGLLKGLDNATIATKIMLLGLYVGIKEEKNKYLTTSVLITAKRHKNKNDIKKSAILATEFITRNEKDRENRNQQKFVPMVLGMDLAGIERGNLPEDIVAQFKESFKSCLMMTVHAGEDESAGSIWQAVYYLHALRIGHALRLNDHPNLKRLFKHRQLCVELCPKSNQYTNGYIACKNNYVFGSYLHYGIPMTVNTDNPLISYRTEKSTMDYPLSKEFLLLPNLVCNNLDKKHNDSDNPFFINSLLILKQIYNGFKYSFLDPKDKARLIEEADREVFNTLAEEFLDVYITYKQKGEI